MLAEPLSATSIRLSWQLSEPVWDMFVDKYWVSFSQIEEGGDDDDEDDGDEEDDNDDDNVLRKEEKMNDDDDFLIV